MKNKIKGQTNKHTYIYTNKKEKRSDGRFGSWFWSVADPQNKWVECIQKDALRPLLLQTEGQNRRSEKSSPQQLELGYSFPKWPVWKAETALPWKLSETKCLVNWDRFGSVLGAWWKLWHVRCPSLPPVVDYGFESRLGHVFSDFVRDISLSLSSRVFSRSFGFIRSFKGKCFQTIYNDNIVQFYLCQH